MRVNTWADEKQLVRDKIEELFLRVAETNAESLEIYIKMGLDDAPKIEYKIKNTLVKFNRKEQTDADN